MKTRPVNLNLFIFFSLGIILFSFPAFAQDGSDVKQALETEWGYWKDILKLLITIAIGVGGVALGYAYATNRQESKDHLTKWVIAIVILGIVRVTVLN